MTNQALWIPMNASGASKHEELANRKYTPLRGSPLKQKLSSKLNSAEDRACGQMIDKVTKVAEHNARVGYVATGARWADELVYVEVTTRLHARRVSGPAWTRNLHAT